MPWNLERPHYKTYLKPNHLLYLSIKSSKKFLYVVFDFIELGIVFSATCALKYK